MCKLKILEYQLSNAFCLSMKELNAIRAMVIGDSSKNNRLVWPFDKWGRSSVKSRYHWIHLRAHDHEGKHMPYIRHAMEHVWKVIWRLNSPPKFQNFMWKSIHKALATMVDLFDRKYSHSPTCPICQNDDESVEHIFLQCPWLEAIWFGGPLNYRVDRDDIPSWP